MKTDEKFELGKMILPLKAIGFGERASLVFCGQTQTDF